MLIITIYWTSSFLSYLVLWITISVSFAAMPNGRPIEGFLKSYFSLYIFLLIMIYSVTLYIEKQSSYMYENVYQKYLWNNSRRYWLIYLYNKNF